MAVFIIVFIMLVHYFILNVFVGVLVGTFAQLRKEGNGVLMLTAHQVLWLHRQRLALKLKARPRLCTPRTSVHINPGLGPHRPRTQAHARTYPSVRTHIIACTHALECMGQVEKRRTQKYDRQASDHV